MCCVWWMHVLKVWIYVLIECIHCVVECVLFADCMCWRYVWLSMFIVWFNVFFLRLHVLIVWFHVLTWLCDWVWFFFLWFCVFLSHLAVEGSGCRILVLVVWFYWISVWFVVFFVFCVYDLVCWLSCCTSIPHSLSLPTHSKKGFHTALPNTHSPVACRIHSNSCFPLFTKVFSQFSFRSSLAIFLQSNYIYSRIRISTHHSPCSSLLDSVFIVSVFFSIRKCSTTAVTSSRSFSWDRAFFHEIVLIPPE